MLNTYYDFMNEIKPDELYERLIEYGLFSEKLPPIFDAGSFLSYCKNINGSNIAAKPKSYSYATFNSMRNINIPRNIGIPTPMSYERLCACLRDNWNELQKHFESTTKQQTHIVSRIHIRKMKETKAIFKMNYSNWRKDGTPEPDILLGKKYLVKADIAKCFPSIYTHSIPWALVTKSVAKANKKNSNLWYNQIDLTTRNTTNAETHGILIGPHTSNILSEIILCKVDEKLSEKWDYIRNVDDYSCYVNSKEEADFFLIELDSILREYKLSLNHKKSEIIELPVGAVERWIRQIQNRTIHLQKFRSYVNYREVQAFLDFCIDLMAKNRDNTSILFYALKILKQYKLTDNAKEYVIKTFTSLALIYPYLVPLLDDYVYTPFITNQSIIDGYINKIYARYFEKKYYEAVSYALFLAVKYDIEIYRFDVHQIIEQKDCILSLCSLIYCRYFNLKKSLKELKAFARKLKDNDEFDEYWPFTYECLTVGLLAGDWKDLKQENVSFLKQEFREEKI